MKISKITKTDKILVIVESPNKVATISKIFKDSGFINTKVMASAGHITEIKDGGSYWNTGIDPKNKFKINYGIIKDKKDIVKKLQDAISKADFIFLATDPDREGEAISWHLKHQLKINDSKYQRITFHEITKPAVLKSLENPRKIDENLVNAAKARAVVDKILGYRLSPIARTYIQAKSVGRCQSAGLKLIVDREEEIKNFKPESYYDLYLYFEKNDQKFKAKYSGTEKKEVKRIDSIEIINKIKTECSKDFIVKSIEKKEQKDNPKPPFTTSTFQQEANKVFGMSVDRAMTCAQRLFEGINIMGEHIALITYIRTDDSAMSPEFADTLAKYVKINYGPEYYAPVKKGTKSSSSQEAHECLRVVNLNMTPSELSKYITDQNLLKIYKMIWTRTVQSSMAPAIISDTAYTIENNSHLFVMHSREVTFEGYRKILVGAAEKDADEEYIKETFKEGEKLLKTALNEELKTTTPPKRYTEASFISQLDKLGIGRPSTFAAIVKTLLSDTRGYCKIENKFIVPTERGIELSKFLDKSFSDLINLNYTCELENDLDLIASGKTEELTFLTDFYTKLEESANKAQSTEYCPECGKPLIRRVSKFGPFLGCSGYPVCKYIKRK